jgi:hypothetical protein
MSDLSTAIVMLGLFALIGFTLYLITKGLGR